MSRNGPIALAYHALFVTFMLAPILVVCFVAFTPEGYLSFPTDTLPSPGRGGICFLLGDW